MVLLGVGVAWATTTIIERGYRLVASTSIHSYELDPCIETVRVYRLRDGLSVGSWWRIFPRWGRPGGTSGLVNGRGRACHTVPGEPDLAMVLDAIDAEQATRKGR